MNYAIGSIFGNTVNIYIHGTAVLSVLTFFAGLVSSGSFEQALMVLLDFYLVKLLPWPLDEAYIAQTVAEFVISHMITIGVGIISATWRYHRSI